MAIMIWRVDRCPFALPTLYILLQFPRSLLVALLIEYFTFFELKMDLLAVHGVLPSNSAHPGIYDDEQADGSLGFGEANLTIPSFMGDGFSWVQEVYRTNFQGST